MFRLSRNERSHWSGNGVHVEPESVFMIGRNMHHLLSDLELAAFLVFEWTSGISDIREQFPLRREDTRAIAAEHGLRHPSVRGVDQVMSSDFLVDTASGPHRQFAVQVKRMEAFSDVRTIEKLELERRYWQQGEIVNILLKIKNSFLPTKQILIGL
ncbi:TnsA endonuclease N-terminal domain-containing protein [Aeromonas caviae]